ncbi:hypothetical protein [Melghirimyces algeriensis]|uniref:Uncharacterized protein n=1 Tax=Melghirimyces algeriensis TaxID=910412 RepID=A0A521FCP3_9BACL|nr:hypothetical protein [Melghirimyces algeriensis]SMO93935.1 hypothetical protein SAMN06264849_11651 [Melghirimyces algeriensis]
MVNRLTGGGNAAREHSMPVKHIDWEASEQSDVRDQRSDMAKAGLPETQFLCPNRRGVRKLVETHTERIITFVFHELYTLCPFPTHP